MFHFCTWKEEGCVYVPPYKGTGLQGAAEMVERLLAGFTSIRLRCPGCGDVMERVLLGDHRPKN